MVTISEPPAEASDRAVTGRWGVHLILGKNGRSAVGTLEVIVRLGWDTRLGMRERPGS
jgi:hypothetical protein